MSKLPCYNSVDLLGMSSLAKIQDEQIWRNFLTPQVRALLGPVVKPGIPVLSDLQEGQFPGDKLSNLNGYALFNERDQPLVRLPYLSTIHRTEYGALSIKRDATKLKITAWTGNIDSGKAQLIHLVGLRDRRYDGTRRANDSPLLDFRYDDPLYHQQLSTKAKCAEVSIYSFLPGSSIVDATGDLEFQSFIRNPFTYLDRPGLFRLYFQRAWQTARAPGQHCTPIRDVSRSLLPALDKIAAAAGYDFLECAVSHYHVALWFKANGYRYTFSEHAATMDEFAMGIQRLKNSGLCLERPQESWLSVVQSLRPTELIQDKLYLDGPIWPQDNIGPKTLWMNKPLNARAENLIKAPRSMHDECNRNSPTKMGLGN